MEHHPSDDSREHGAPDGADRWILEADALFDGVRLQRSPKRVLIADGTIAAIQERDEPAPVGWNRATRRSVAFAMPGLVEAHAHLFLDGGELDLQRRKAHLAGDKAALLATGRENLRRSAACGVTLIRDAGDPHGINHALRAEALAAGSLPRVRSAGFAIRKRGRYGSFLGRDVRERADIAPLVAEAAAEADEIKILLTGIIDFAAGAVKGAPQFTAEELRDLVGAARAHGLSTLAHCSGRAGLELAVAKGIDSIEHGFFMSEDILRAMARQGTLWVPTWSPVDFQRRRPDILGLDDAAVDGLTRILAQHRAMIARAAELGVRLTAGSDAGSQGVVHGRALIDELRAFADAGLGIETILASATSVPRKSWGLDGGILHPGAKTDMACYARIPTATDLSALDRAQMVVIGDASGRKRIGAPIGRIPPLQCGHAMC